MSADGILLGRSEEGEMVRGECRRLDQIRGPQRSSLLSDPESFFPHINLAFDSPGRTHMESQP